VSTVFHQRGGRTTEIIAPRSVLAERRITLLSVYSRLETVLGASRSGEMVRSCTRGLSESRVNSEKPRSRSQREMSKSDICYSGPYQVHCVTLHCRQFLNATGDVISLCPLVALLKVGECHRDESDGPPLSYNLPAFIGGSCMRIVSMDLGKPTFTWLHWESETKLCSGRNSHGRPLLAYTARLPASLIGLDARAGAHL
jgi:hypothetical protein